MALTENAQMPLGAADYDTGGCFDEAFAGPGSPREHYGPLISDLGRCDLAALRAAVSDSMARSGASFGDNGAFVVDAVPRLLAGAEWKLLERGLGQRARALDAFVADVYGEQRIVAAGVLSERTLNAAPFLEPELRELAPRRGARIAIAGLDVVRAEAGEFLVLEDNVRTPSGMAYALAARRVVEQHLPHESDRLEIRAELGRLLRGVLDAARPDPESDACAVIVSDGPGNPAYFEHRELAALAGVKLVGPQDLRSDGPTLRLRADGQAVGVVYRRTNEDRMWSASGALTVLGELLVEPLRAGALGLVNAFGTGVADDKRVHPHVEQMIGFYLGEETLLRSVASFDLTDESELDAALGSLDRLVVKPRDGHGGEGVVIGAQATAAELREVARRIQRDPADWVAQPTVALSSHPTIVEGRLQPRRVDLRPFVFFDGDQARLMPGGLTRVALAKGSLVVNSSRGGGAKDTWVLP